MEQSDKPMGTRKAKLARLARVIDDEMDLTSTGRVMVKGSLMYMVEKLSAKVDIIGLVEFIIKHADHEFAGECLKKLQDLKTELDFVPGNNKPLGAMPIRETDQ